MTSSITQTTSVPEVQTLHDISGTLSIIVEVAIVIANLLPVAFILRHETKTTRSVMDDLILTLSITHILSVIIPTPLGLVSYFRKQWVGGLASCQFYRVMTLWFQLSAMLLVTCLCFDRYLALRATLFYTISIRNIFTNLRLLIVAIFSLSLLIACLPVMGLAPTAFPKSATLCDSWFTARLDREAQTVFFIIFLFFGYTNCLISASLTLKLVTLLWRYRAKFTHVIKSRDNCNAGSTSMPVDRKCVVQFTRVVLTVSTLYYFTWFLTLTMVLLRVTQQRVSDASVMYAFLSTSLTSLLNPLIYPLFASSYRRGYKTVLTDVTRCLLPCSAKTFQPLPSIAGGDGACAHPSHLSTSKSRSNLRRTKSLDDEPNCAGLINAAYLPSLYSAVDGFGANLEEECLAHNMKTRRRVRSLSPSSRFMIRRRSTSASRSDESGSTCSMMSLAMEGSSATDDSESSHSCDEETRI